MWAVKAFRASAFLKNAACLTGTSLILRTVGLFFRVYLSNRLGAEGMGVYQLILSVYTLVSAFAAAGICTAVTRLVTDSLCRGEGAAARRVLRLAVGLSIGLGVLFGVGVYVAAPWIGERLLRETRAVTALRVLAFGLPFMGVSSCLRGYFMARRRVRVSSQAQLLEQTVRIVVIVRLLGRHGFDLRQACAAVLFGDTVAEAAACLYLFWGYRRDRRGVEAPPSAAVPRGRTLSALAAIALPITATRYINTGLHTLENLLVPERLSRFTGSRTVALAQFGALKGMTMPLLFFPASFLSAVSALLVPEISASAALGQRRAVQEAVERSLRLTLTAAGFIGAVFYVYAPLFGEKLYHSAEVGYMVRALAPLVPAMYVESVADGILKGLNQQVAGFRYSVADSAVRIGLTLWLVPRTGMAGFLAMMTVSNLLVAFLEVRRLLRVSGLRGGWGRWLWGPLAAATVSGLGGWCVQRIAPVAALPEWGGAAVGLAVMGALYGLLLWGGRLVSKQDLRPLPRST